MNGMSVSSEAASAAVVDVGSGGCNWCRREAPCECMTSVKDGGPWAWGIVPGVFVLTGDGGWSLHPERCMCSCGGCQE